MPWDWRTRTIDAEEPEDIPLVKEFRQKLASNGWLTMAWPEEYGGQSASHIKQVVFNEEMASREIPANDAGVRMVGPVIMLYGTEEQKREFLPRIARAEIDWAQGYSEPGRRVRPGVITDQSHSGWRRLRGKRVQDMERRAFGCGLDVHAGAHRPRRAKASGYQLPTGRDGLPRRNRGKRFQ